jgi:hypothetical protein
MESMPFIEVEAVKWLEMAAGGNDPEIAEEARKELERLVGAEGPFYSSPHPSKKKDREASIFVDPGLASGGGAPNMSLL